MPQTHDAFAAACLPHQNAIRTIAMRLCRDRDAAADLVQETLLQAMVNWSSYDPTLSVKTWLGRILTNEFINGYRARKLHEEREVEHRDAVLIGLYGHTEDHTEPPDAALCHDELCDEVKEALKTLGPAYRDVVERADLKGERYHEIAEAVDVPMGTVMSRLFRARRSLEKQLAPVAARDYGIIRRRVSTSNV